MVSFNDFLSEGRHVTLKRRYTENYPAIKAGKSARIRNKMLEAIADGKLTQEEFNNILKEFSKDSGKWMRRNSKFFNVSEEGISLSKFGKRALSQITVNESQLFEGQFSWMAQDTGTQIGSESENMITVYMYDHEGNRWEEKRYEGYGEFGGMDYYELLARMNGYSEEDLEGKEELRDIGIDLAFDQKKFKPKNGKKVLFPALVEDPRYNWKRHDFTQEADNDPNQSWYSEPEYDDEDGYWDESANVEEGRAFVAAAQKAKDEGKDEFEFDGKKYQVTIKENKSMKINKIYESFEEFINSTKETVVSEALCEATVQMDAMDPKDKDFLRFLKKHNVEIIDIAKGANGHEITMQGKRKDLENVLADSELGWDDADLAEYIEESVVNEDVFADLEAAISDMDFDAYQNLAFEFGVDDGDPNQMMDFIYNELDKKGAKLLIKNINKGVYESKEIVNEKFSSMKLQSILTSAGSMPKDFAKTLYQRAKVQLDKIQDVDILEMSPEQARKEKRSNAIYLYFTTNEKPNPYAGRNSYGVSTIPGNTLLGVTDGSNEWLAAQYGSRWSKDRTKSLSTSKRNDGAGFGKSAANDTWGSGISSLSKVAELADRAYVLDLDILRARYSAEAQRDQRVAAKSGATAFKSEKDFKAENLARYHTILADRAANLPIDKEVLKAIDVVTAQIKDGLASGKKGKYGDVMIGEDPKGREVKLRDASNMMQNLLDDFNRYVDYTNQAKSEEESGYGSNYYSREVKNYAKSIKDKITKINNMDYAW